MSGLLSRVKTILGAKANQALDNVEDPTQTLDYSYSKMEEALQETKRHIIDVVTAKKQLEMQRNALQDKATQYDTDAQEAVKAGRDDLATQALTLKSPIQQEIDGLNTHIASIQAEEDKLHHAQEQLEQKITTFKNQKEVMKAQYSAAKADVQVNETIHGISQHAEDVSNTLERAQDKISQMQARAGALDEMEDTSSFNSSDDADPVRAQLNASSTSQSVSDELKRLKSQLNKP